MLPRISTRQNPPFVLLVEELEKPSYNSSPQISSLQGQGRIQQQQRQWQEDQIQKEKLQQIQKLKKNGGVKGSSKRRLERKPRQLQGEGAITVSRTDQPTESPGFNETTAASDASLSNESAADTSGDSEGEVLVIGVQFLVASTSFSESNHAVSPEELTDVLEFFAIQVTSEWAYRKQGGNQRQLLLFLRGHSNKIKTTSQPHQQQQQQQSTPQHRRRRLQVKLIDGSVQVFPTLTPSNECPVSITSTTAEGEYNHCHRAHGRFDVQISAEETEDAVCRNMKTSVVSLMQSDYLMDALGLVVRSTNTTLDLQPGEMEYCLPFLEYTPPPAATASPNNNASTTAPSTTWTTSSGSNIFDQANDTNTNSNTTPGASVPTMAPASSPTVSPAPSSEEYTNEWLDLLEDAKEEEDKNNEEEETTPPNLFGATTNEDVENVDDDSANAEEDTGNPTSSSSSSSSSPGSYSWNRNYTADMIALRAEVWDDSFMDFVIMIVGCSLGGLLCLFCCCYATDNCYNSYMYGDDVDDHERRGSQIEEFGQSVNYGANGELLHALGEEDEEYSDSGEQGSDEDDEAYEKRTSKNMRVSQLYMSESDEDQFDDGEDEEDEFDDGDFYVNDFEEEDGEDEFDDDAEFGDEDSFAEQSDRFDDEENAFGGVGGGKNHSPGTDSTKDNSS